MTSQVLTSRPAAQADALTTLQRLSWPEQGICTEGQLYMRLEEHAAFSDSRGEISFPRNGVARFNTWFNLFNLGKWVEHCGLKSLWLALEGEGCFELTVVMTSPVRSWERLDDIVILTEGVPCHVDLTEMMADHVDEGIVFFELRAIRSGRLSGAEWKTADAPKRVPELALSITTFRREAAVTRTAARFDRYIAESPHRDHIHLIVVDNGQSVGIENTDKITVVPNENLGGAGGFSRGMLEARDRGASHCLFMDDDASIHMSSLDRIWQFLAYATDPGTAVAGSMINAQHRWAIWENGALFDGRCLPQHMGTDLRDPPQVFDMEYDTTRPVPDNFYGGWWYFAFPLDRATHMPFPFFVRGDDVSFSLVHDFNIVTLNGVVSFQESFTDKESPQTWYLDLRSHMAHHLSLPAMERGRMGVLKIAIWFFLRNLPRMHYETISAINLAFEDVMRGPEFFDTHADMAQRRADIKALTRQEAWGPARGLKPEDSKWRMNPRSRWTRFFMKITLNGHLLPFFSRFGNRAVLDAADRGNLAWTWGACEITYLSSNRRQCYTVRHSKRAFLREGMRMARNSWRFLRGYDGISAAYRKGYEDLTDETYWRAKLGMTSPAATPETTAATPADTATGGGRPV